MTPFFRSDERQKALKNELKAWIGTPWRHHCGVKSEGADCVGTIYGVLTNLKFIDPAKIKIPRYLRDWHIHTKEKLLYCGFKDLAPQFLEIDKAQPTMNGDILLFRFGLSASHVGILFDRQIFHTPANCTTMGTPANDGFLEKRLMSVFRCMEGVAS